MAAPGGSNRLCGRYGYPDMGVAHPAYRGQGSVLDSEEGIRFRGRTVSFHFGVLDVINANSLARFLNVKNCYPKLLVERNPFPKVITSCVDSSKVSGAELCRSILASTNWRCTK